MNALSFDELVVLTRDRAGRFDVPCPLCAPLYNRRKKVLRIWRESDAFIGFSCARCGEKGWARDGRTAAVRPSPERLAKIRQEAAQRDAEETAAGLRKTRWLWSQRKPIPGSPAETYLREARGYRGPFPASLGYLPASNGHPHALIAAFAPVGELTAEDGASEPGIITVADTDVKGVHLVKLAPDGSDRLREHDTPKVSIGRGSTGTPIVLSAMNDLLGLVITEGIESGLTLYDLTGCGVWASAGASRLPALAEAVPDYTDCITVFADADPDGVKHARALCDRLAERGLTVETKFADGGAA